MSDAPELALPDIVAANARHDAEHGDPLKWNTSRTRCGYGTAKILRRSLRLQRPTKKQDGVKRHDLANRNELTKSSRSAYCRYRRRKPIAARGGVRGRTGNPGESLPRGFHPLTPI